MVDMNGYNISINPITEQDVAGLNVLPPVEWEFDYESFLKKYLKKDFYLPFLMTIDPPHTIVGSGSVFIKDHVGWLANIFVDPMHRGKGLGYQLTQHLVECLDQHQCHTKLLIATELGEPVYKKIGFRKTTTYQGYRSETTPSVQPISGHHVRPLVKEDLEQVLALDYEINHENRIHFIQDFYLTGYGYFKEDHQLEGIYLPDFSRGLVIARDQEPGLELLKLKHSQKNKTSYIPVENQHAIEYCETQKFKRLANLSRMVLGDDLDWGPEGIYSYGSGYSG